MSKIEEVFCGVVGYAFHEWAAACSTSPSKGVRVMREPITTLDPRYSDPEAAATQWEETCRVIETAQVFWLSTVRADGRPHVTPVVAVWDGEALYFCTGDSEQKARNLRDNPQVILTTGCNHWNEGPDAVVEGEARRVTDQDRLERLAQLWATKWDGRFQFQARDGYFHDPNVPESVLVFSVTPGKVFAFGRGHHHDSHTRHQF
jgi:PPOX class probable F420-dependent enzyme